MSTNCLIGLIGIPSCVLIEISFDLRTLGIPRAVVDGIRAVLVWCSVSIHLALASSFNFVPTYVGFTLPLLA